ncbi:MAG: hypothetical protein QOG36_1458 [Actinomycetota bacterium]|nr:hypothetical protein [Actinomycetota bacterium]
MSQGDSQLIPLRCAPGGCYSPLDPPAVVRASGVHCMLMHYGA